MQQILQQKGSPEEQLLTWPHRDIMFDLNLTRMSSSLSKEEGFSRLAGQCM